MSATMRLSVVSYMFLVTVALSGILSEVKSLDSVVSSSSSSKLVSSSTSSKVKSTISTSSWEPQIRAARQTTVVTASSMPLGPVFTGRTSTSISNGSESTPRSAVISSIRAARSFEASSTTQHQQTTTVPSVISVRSIVTSNSPSPVYTASSSNFSPQRASLAANSSGFATSSTRNKPLLNALVSKLEVLSSKLDQLTSAQSSIQKAFDTLESRFSLSATMDDVPQCGRRVDRVLRTLTPLVSRVEGLWSVVSGYSSNPSLNSFAGNAKQATNNVNVPPSQFLAAPGDALLSESRRQERAISAIRSDLNAKSQQILSELGTVEQQLDVLQGNIKRGPPSGQVDTSDLQAPVENNDVTFQVVDPSYQTVGGGIVNIRNQTTTAGVTAIVFPSVKNKPIADASALDGADALLTGSGQTRSSCAELMMQPGQKRSGLYHIRLPGARSSFWQLLVYCDQETTGGGWMVVQRRADYPEPRESFHRNWVEYRSGFGDPIRELWIGNINLHLLTNSEDQVLRIELEDFDGEKRYAEYSTFRVASEADAFRLEVGGYSGDAGDALSDPWYGAHGSAFSTHDRDNDRSSLNCASMLKGGWWWKSCGRGLNGLYFDSQQPDSALARQGIVWFRWKGWDYTLKKATMMIRPKSFRPSNYTASFTSQI